MMSDAAGGPAYEGPLAASLRNVSKSFFGTAAVSGVDLDLVTGEVHAVLGENGAGKSTLCSVLAGLYRPEEGEVTVGGVRRDFRSPGDALAAGVGMVYQSFRLVKPLTVAENLMLGHPDAPRWTSRRKARDWAEQMSAAHGIEVRPDAIVGDLSLGEQQRIEILKLLARGVRVLILDEATAVLAPREVSQLLATIQSLASQGTSVVMVTHKLDEVMQVADQVTILRDGRHVDTVAVADTSASALAHAMVDRAIVSRPQGPSRLKVPPSDASSQPLLKVSGLHVAGCDGAAAVHDVNIEVMSGEIVGIAGVSGNGQETLARAIGGLTPADQGVVSLAGEDVTDWSVRARCAHGLGFVPEDRLGRGVAAGLTLEQNLALRHYWQPQFRRGPLLSKRAIKEHASQIRQRIEIRGARDGMPTSLLSGGNVQRAILARELGEDTRVVMACSPTHGLDPSATQTAHQILKDRCSDGVGVLLISEDLEEVLELSDRVLVMFDGRIVGSMLATEIDRARIGLWMSGTTEVTG